VVATAESLIHSLSLAADWRASAASVAVHFQRDPIGAFEQAFEQRLNLLSVHEHVFGVAVRKHFPADEQRVQVAHRR
jgi:hypothetical protein